MIVPMLLFYLFQFQSFYFSRFFLPYFFYFSLFFCLGNCFEYEENIYFKKGFTGYVEIHYTVPINQKTGRSVIKFLPLKQDEIEKKMSQGIFGKSIQIRDYSLQVIEKEDISINTYFTKKAKISYKVDFTELSNLDGVLLGNLFVKRKGNSIFIKREFKSVLKPLDTDSSAGEKKIRSETLRLLGDGYVQFRVYFPQSSECRSSLGEVNLGWLNYKFLLNDTIEKSGNRIWDFSITTY
jgi:hypothetical protein